MTAIISCAVSVVGASVEFGMQVSSVDFQRMWQDKGTSQPTREGLSLWRPCPPAGYFSLGVCRRQWLVLFIQMYLSCCVALLGATTQDITSDHGQ